MSHLLRGHASASFIIVVALSIAIGSIADGQSSPPERTTRITFTIDAEKNVKPISPFIYGANQPLQGDLSHLALRRVGGNRWSAYNWVNNASNAGSDYHFQNDGFLGGGDEPGGALLEAISNTASSNAALMITIPMTSYVSADKNGDGDVRKSGADYLQTRFRLEKARKGAPFNLHPNPNNPVVYQDEFVNWVKSKCPYMFGDPRRPVFFALDNEPDLWSSTHAEVHPAPVTYSEITQKGIDYARAIKNVLPRAKIFGPENYGWSGFVSLQDAPDANHRDFQEYYLDQMAAAQKRYGNRLLDVMDVHWYPEATADGARITSQDAPPAVAAVRVQTPRSLWDPTYTETSWITQWQTKGPIALLPRLWNKIDNHYPGTALSMSEYNYGGGSDISGAIAQADTLGIFGQYGLFAACEWPMVEREPFIHAGFRMYRDFDGKGAAFGDLSIGAFTSDVSSATIYASLHHDHRNWMTLVAINKTGHELPADFVLHHAEKLSVAKVYQLTSSAAQPMAAGSVRIPTPGRFTYAMPPMSVTTLRLSDAQ
jgi:hypothetical protein